MPIDGSDISPENDKSSIANTADIIPFPTKHCRPEILSNEIVAREKKAKEYYSVEAAHRFFGECIEGFISYGVHVEDVAFQKDLAFLHRLFIAIFMRSVEIAHPMHELIDKGEKVIDEDGDVIWDWSKVEALLTTKSPVNKTTTKRKKMPSRQQHPAQANNVVDVSE